MKDNGVDQGTTNVKANIYRMSRGSRQPARVQVTENRNVSTT